MNSFNKLQVALKEVFKGKKCDVLISCIDQEWCCVEDKDKEILVIDYSFDEINYMTLDNIEDVQIVDDFVFLKVYSDFGGYNNYCLPNEKMLSYQDFRTKYKELL